MARRCAWAGSDPLYISYHDTEWGVPLHDERKLFEFLILDGQQAGLSWLTILRKRDHFRAAFDSFDAEKIVRYDKLKISELMNNQGIIRNKLKIESVVRNASAFLKAQEEFDGFDRYIWRFVDGETIKNSWKTESEIPATSSESQNMSKDLKRRGFTFVGPTICYAFMQAAGMVNDHIVDCFRYQEVMQDQRVLP